MNDAALGALSPLDGRYAERLAPLAEVFSEQALMRRRVEVEIHWLLALCACRQLPEAPPLGAALRERLHALHRDFGAADARRIKTLERATRHDVKAVERWLREKLRRLSRRRGMKKLEQLREFVHFGCTSEDINNLAYALMIRQARDDVLLPAQRRMELKLRAMARGAAAAPMLARTHGQAPAPTTLGKELAVFALRLRQQRLQIQQTPIAGKINGAVGNFNAHRVGAGDVDWIGLGATLVARLGLELSPLTTPDRTARLDGGTDARADALQHGPHGSVTRLLAIHLDGLSAHDAQNRRSRLLDDAAQAQSHRFRKRRRQPRSRQRSAVASGGQTAGVAAAARLERLHRHAQRRRRPRATACSPSIPWKRGLGRAAPDRARMLADLENRWEVLTEAVQTVMRRHGLEDPYERLKKLSRGKALDRETLHAFIDGVELPEVEKRRLLALRPLDYVGFAPQLARATLKSLGSS